MLKKIRFSSFKKRALGIVAAVQLAVLTGAGLTPALIGTASAAQLTSRKITMGYSNTSRTDVTYTPSFVIATTGNIRGIVVDFCSDSPLIGQTCTAPTGFDVNESGLAIANQTGISGFTIDAATDTNTVVLVNAAGGSVNSATTVSFDLGAGGGADGITNPSTNGSFYARILTYATTAGATGYVSTAPNTGAARTDDGGVAMSTNNQLTINARVQEQLQFCVGTTDAATNNDCTDISGTSIDLGVVDSTAVAASANDAGKAMVRTNAQSGVVIVYRSEQNTSSGKLKVAGATCSGVSTADQCFNSATTTQQPIVAGAEMYGMTIESVNQTNGSTTNLGEDPEYDGSGDGYAWDDTGTADQIASSSTVVDDEMLELKFAATASITTPPGAYTVTATFIATATF
jgi:hypothetical protein